MNGKNWKLLQNYDVFKRWGDSETYYKATFTSVDCEDGSSELKAVCLCVKFDLSVEPVFNLREAGNEYQHYKVLFSSNIFFAGVAFATAKQDDSQNTKPEFVTAIPVLEGGLKMPGGFKWEEFNDIKISVSPVKLEDFFERNIIACPQDHAYNDLPLRRKQFKIYVYPGLEEMYDMALSKVNKQHDKAKAQLDEANSKNRDQEQDGLRLVPMVKSVDGGQWIKNGLTKSLIPEEATIILQQCLFWKGNYIPIDGAELRIHILRTIANGESCPKVTWEFQSLAPYTSRIDHDIMSSPAANPPTTLEVKYGASEGTSNQGCPVISPILPVNHLYLSKLL